MGPGVAACGCRSLDWNPRHVTAGAGVCLVEVASAWRGAWLVLDVLLWPERPTRRDERVVSLGFTQCWPLQWPADGCSRMFEHVANEGGSVRISCNWSKITLSCRVFNKLHNRGRGGGESRSLLSLLVVSFQPSASWGASLSHNSCVIDIPQLTTEAPRPTGLFPNSLFGADLRQVQRWVSAGASSSLQSWATWQHQKARCVLRCTSLRTCYSLQASYSPSLRRPQGGSSRGGGSCGWPTQSSAPRQDPPYSPQSPGVGRRARRKRAKPTSRL